MFRSAAIGLTLALTGCAGTAAGPDSAPAPRGPLAGLSLVPGPGGLDVAGSGGRQIGFGRDRAGAIASAARVTGEAPRPIGCAEAGRDAVALGSLLMIFERGAFVGTTDTGARHGRACTATV